MSYPTPKVIHFCLVILFCAQSFIISTLPAQTAMAQALHPLDSLTAEEIQTAARVLHASAQFPEGALFSTIVLKEPLKNDVLGYQPGRQARRQAFAVILDRKGSAIQVVK